MMILFLLLAQAPLPTVGDTLWVVRRLAVPAGYDVRPAIWTPSGAVELLGQPRVSRVGDIAEVRYPAVAWEPGSHTVEVPGPILRAPDGRTDSLPPETVTLVVASVLPEVPRDSTLPIRPPAVVLLQPSYSIVPLLVAYALSAVFLAPWVWWWRRRRKARLPPSSVAVAPGPPVARWSEAGEERAVAAAASVRLRAAIARHVPEAHPALDAQDCLALLAAARPKWPLDELARLMHQLETTRFAPVVATEAPMLYQRAVELARTLPSSEGP